MEIKTKKMNIGLKISRNYNTCTCEVVDEPIEYSSESELQAKIRKIFNTLSEEVELQFKKIEEKK